MYNTWFSGQPDVDCLNDALCCFDGCANVCQGAGPIPSNPLAGSGSQAFPAAVPAVPAPAPAPAPPRPAPAPANNFQVFTF